MGDRLIRALAHALAAAPEPAAALERFLDLPFPLLLDGAAEPDGLGRFSYVTADPAVALRAHGSRTERRAAGDDAWTPVAGDVLAAARAALAPFRTSARPELPPFQGGLAGYLGYELAGVLERLPPPRGEGVPAADAVLGLYDWVIAWDHANGRAWVVSTGMPEVGPARETRAAQRLEWVLGRLQDGIPTGRARGLAPATARSDAARAPGSVPTHPVTGYERVGLRSTFTRDEYLAAVARVREYILAGDIFQANLSQRFDAPLGEAPWRFYRRLRRRNPAPFGAYFETADAAVLSVSPERFLRLDAHADGTATVDTRPIKGTRPRGADATADAALAAELLASTKDRAENVMIVDLLRNDLSRVCVPGTVAVPSLLALATHPTVHHLVSTVTGRLAPGRDAFDLLRAAFPGGSITGAPKVRAMEIIAELEPTARGVYCGAIGYVSVTGAMETSIAIRTATVRGGRLRVHAGGGIVADSDPAAEYDETLAKARAIVDALGDAP